MSYLDTFNPLVGQRYQELVLAQEVLGETDDRSSVADVQRFIFTQSSTYDFTPWHRQCRRKSFGR